MSPPITVATTTGGSALPPLHECRVYQRLDCEMPTSCHPASLLEAKETPWAGVIRNLSQGGVCVVLTRRFEKGTPLAIELPGDGEREPTVVFAKVVHLRAGKNGQWVLGCRFISDLSADEVQRLVKSKRYVLAPKSEPKPARINDAADA